MSAQPGDKFTESSVGLFDKTGRLHATDPHGFDLSEWVRGCTVHPLTRTVSVVGQRTSRVAGLVPEVEYSDWTLADGTPLMKRGTGLYLS